MTKQLIEKAPAKVNLSLGVTGKQADGYHLLEMVNHSVDLADELILTPGGPFEFKINQPGLNNRENLIIRVIQLMCQLLNRTPDFKMECIKNIPENAGLAGGSADAAAMLRLIRDYWHLNLTDSQLNGLALKVGADVPFCLKNGTAYVEGLGERVYPIKAFKPEATVIVNPGIKIATPKAYQLLDKESQLVLPESLKVVRAIEDHDYNKIKDVAANSFTQPVARAYPVITEVIDKLYDQDAFYATMSGSGSSIVGFFDSKQKAQAACEKLQPFQTNLI